MGVKSFLFDLLYSRRIGYNVLQISVSALGQLLFHLLIVWLISYWYVLDDDVLD